MIPEMSDAERAILVTDAIVYQLEYELDSFWGWTPNDLAGYGPLAWPSLFDNRQWRQRGIRFAVSQFVPVWSRQTTKLGNSDRESVDLLNSYNDGGFAIGPDVWFLPAAEGSYRDGIRNVRLYQENLLAGNTGRASVNITTRNLVVVMRALSEDVLGEPYGRLIERNSQLGWLQLDNEVYRAQGAAIVARDVLAAITVGWYDELVERQVIENLEQAIDSLDAATHFNPLFIMRGDGDSMIADHRSKMARYISEAQNRINEAVLALES